MGQVVQTARGRLPRFRPPPPPPPQIRPFNPQGRPSGGRGEQCTHLGEIRSYEDEKDVVHEEDQEKQSAALAKEKKSPVKTDTAPPADGGEGRGRSCSSPPPCQLACLPELHLPWPTGNPFRAPPPEDGGAWKLPNSPESSPPRHNRCPALLQSGRPKAPPRLCPGLWGPPMAAGREGGKRGGRTQRRQFSAGFSGSSEAMAGQCVCVCVSLSCVCGGEGLRHGCLTLKVGKRIVFSM